MSVMDGATLIQSLFGSQQNGVRETAGIGRSAEDLAGIVDSGDIRYGEAGVGGNQCIEINQHAAAVNEDVLARLERMVAGYGKDCDTNDLARGIDPRRRGSRSSRERAQIGPDAIIVESRVWGLAAEVKRPDDLADAIDGLCVGGISTGGYAEIGHFPIGV